MAEIAALRTKWVGPAVLCFACMSLPARSAPPVEKALIGRGTQPLAAATAHSAPLDLRPPPVAGATGNRFADIAGILGAEEDKRFAALGAAMSQERSSNRPEALIQRFHREGLPIARLWQGHAAVVSLGLNPKGKPGVWLVKKIR